MDFITAVFTQPMIGRGALIGLLVSLCAALLGVCLVLKRCSMIGDGLSHVAFGTLSIAFALNFAPLLITIPVVMATAFLLLRLSESSSIKGDSAIALISSTALAVGVCAASIGNISIDVNSYMFGSIWLVGKEELYYCIPLAIIVIAVFVFCYHDIFLVTCDEEFAKASGTKVEVYKSVIALLTALVIVIGMRIMGTLLISSLVIFPALTSMRVFKSFRGVVLCSAAVSAVGFILGLALSYYSSMPTGASVIVVNALFFAAFSVIGKLAGKK